MGRMNDGETGLAIAGMKDATAVATDLFRRCFGQPFPTPRDDVGLAIPTPPEHWFQYVARYRWPGGEEETVGFVNFIRFEDVYLEGGMCVDESFYRRMPREHFRACRARGGIAQMMMAAAAADLDDADAWFGYCGDAKALAVDLRAGYERTRHPKLIVKWFRALPQERREALIERIAAIGPF